MLGGAIALENFIWSTPRYADKRSPNRQWVMLVRSEILIWATKEIPYPLPPRRIQFTIPAMSVTDLEAASSFRCIQWALKHPLDPSTLATAGAFCSNSTGTEVLCVTVVLPHYYAWVCGSKDRMLIQIGPTPVLKIGFVQHYLVGFCGWKCTHILVAPRNGIAELNHRDLLHLCLSSKVMQTYRDNLSSRIYIDSSGTSSGFKPEEQSHFLTFCLRL